MGIGYDICCRNCDFSFLTGWSHHTASDNCVCTNCATVFSIKGFQSLWGISDSEVCHLYQSIKPKKQRKKKRDQATEYDTGVQVIGVTSSQECTLPTDKTITVETFTFRLEGIGCPSCQQKASLRLSLESGDQCPKCRIGSIENRGMVEYWNFP